MGRLYDIAVQRMINYLAQQGKKIVTEAMNTKAVGNRTFNQNDAFGYVVYHNGEIKKKGYANPIPMSTQTHHGWSKHGIPEGTGREWLNDFIASYDEVPKKGFALLIVNAAFYSKIQEVKYKYQIISQVYGELDTIATKFKGAEVREL